MTFIRFLIKNVASVYFRIDFPEKNVLCCVGISVVTFYIAWLILGIVYVFTKRSCFCFRYFLLLFSCSLTHNMLPKRFKFEDAYMSLLFTGDLDPGATVLANRRCSAYPSEHSLISILSMSFINDYYALTFDFINKFLAGFVKF